MSIFDDELDIMNKIEVGVLIPIIRKILNFISGWMQGYSTCVDMDINSILKKNGYEATSEELRKYDTIGDIWYHFLDYKRDYSVQQEDENYLYSFTIPKDPDVILDKNNIKDTEYLSTTLKFSKVEIIIINGYPYISAVGNNILLMKYYPIGGIPDFIKFFGRPTIVLMDDTILDKIRGIRNDCFFVKYQEGYDLDNVIKEEVISYDKIKNFSYPYDVFDWSWLQKNGSEFILKTNYASAYQNIYSGAPNWNLSSLQM